MSSVPLAQPVSKSIQLGVASACATPLPAIPLPVADAGDVMQVAQPRQHLACQLGKVPLWDDAYLTGSTMWHPLMDIWTYQMPISTARGSNDAVSMLPWLSSLFLHQLDAHHQWNCHWGAAPCRPGGTRSHKACLTLSPTVCCCCCCFCQCHQRQVPRPGDNQAVPSAAATTEIPHPSAPSRW